MSRHRKGYRRNFTQSFAHWNDWNAYVSRTYLKPGAGDFFQFPRDDGDEYQDEPEYDEEFLDEDYEPPEFVPLHPSVNQMETVVFNLFEIGTNLLGASIILGQARDAIYDSEEEHTVLNQRLSQRMYDDLTALIFAQKIVFAYHVWLPYVHLATSLVRLTNHEYHNHADFLNDETAALLEKAAALAGPIANQMPEILYSGEKADRSVHILSPVIRMLERLGKHFLYATPRSPGTIAQLKDRIKGTIEAKRVDIMASVELSLRRGGIARVAIDQIHRQGRLYSDMFPRTGFAEAFVRKARDATKNAEHELSDKVDEWMDILLDEVVGEGGAMSSVVLPPIPPRSERLSWSTI